MSLQPLKTKPDYGNINNHPQDYTDKELIELSDELVKIAKEIINPYLNTSPTELKRLLGKEDNPEKIQQIKDALNYWRKTVPGLRQK